MQEGQGVSERKKTIVKGYVHLQGAKSTIVSDNGQKVGTWTFLKVNLNHQKTWDERSLGHGGAGMHDLVFLGYSQTRLSGLCGNFF